MKGLRAQRDARTLLRSMGYAVIEPQVEHLDRGDLVLLDHPLTCQVKHYDNLGRAIREALTEVAAQAERNGHQAGLGIIRPPGRPDPADMLVVFRLGTLRAVTDALTNSRSTP